MEEIRLKKDEYKREMVEKMNEKIDIEK